MFTPEDRSSIVASSSKIFRADRLMIYDLQPSNLHGLRRVSWVGSVLPQILYKSQNGGSGSRWSTIVIYLSDVWIFVTADNLCALVDSGRLV